MAAFSCLLLMFITLNIVIRPVQGGFKRVVGLVTMVVFPAVALLIAYTSARESIVIGVIYGFAAVALLVNAVYLNKTKFRRRV